MAKDECVSGKARSPNGKRKPRVIEPGGVYHVMSRFVAKEYFFESSVERTRYWNLFGDAIKSSDWECFTSCLMSNHMHHGTVAGHMSVPEVFKPAHDEFAQWLNKRRGRMGTVFMRGPKTKAFPASAVAHLVAYIHENPVRAGVISDPAHGDWSTYRAYMGLAQVPDWLNVDLGLRLAGFFDAERLDRWCRGMRVTRQDLDALELDRPSRGRRPLEKSGYAKPA